ncbi:serine protease FAM111A-like [Triplophysa rosa]|uniref:serine protease FAM111A-like n=1 Tax=Triplophysa rosa TaxID=992332 RepID=UPI00254627D7|nr:serine protease FAM111A-like [Triplophysa rosa]XP_057180789.1 serine protease FAM111A-like [Triplophysa rosa]XP_057180799.1 serine protease FAM111A-like [Triplophysa rosa]XP_057180807.1 serine protease FAM111A-like [Triplophysa rosa]
MDKALKKEEGASSDQQQPAENEGKVFQFSIKDKKGTYKVQCNTSMTVIAALEASDAFKHLKVKDKEIIIQRGKGKVPGAAVKKYFPCCLLVDDEILEISFVSDEEDISNDQESAQKSDQKAEPTSPSEYKVIYVRTRGQAKKIIMKKTQPKLDYVCVYALNQNTLKEALVNDGRFMNEILNCFFTLKTPSEDQSFDPSMLMHTLPEDQFEIYVQVPKKSRPKKSQSSANNESNKAQADPSTSDQIKIEFTWKSNLFQEKNSHIPPSTEKILSDELKHLLEKLKDSQAQKLFEEKFDKSIKNFGEVSRMKELMRFSDSVCVIVAEGSGLGTGFLLFDRFILTNAHVVKDFLSDERKLSVPFGAAFNYEHQFSKEFEFLQIKEDLALYLLETDDKMVDGKHLDYALLELNIDPPSKYPQLLSFYKDNPPNSDFIYIVGHPNCETKKVDVCCIIDTKNQLQAINKHKQENPICPYVSWQIWPCLRENQITYDTCFFHGASGSPVFDKNCSLIGVHTGGFAYKDSNNQTRSVIEYCISMKSIRESIFETGPPDITELLHKFEEAQIDKKKQREQNEEPMQTDN